MLGRGRQDEIEGAPLQGSFNNITHEPGVPVQPAARASPTLGRRLRRFSVGSVGSVGSTSSQSPVDGVQRTGSDSEEKEGWQRKLFRGFSAWGSSFNLLSKGSSLNPAERKEPECEESSKVPVPVRPRVGGKLGLSFKGGIKNLMGVHDDQLVMKEQIGEGTCGLVFRAVFNGHEVAVKVLKQVEQYEFEGTCPVDARDSFTR